VLGDTVVSEIGDAEIVEASEQTGGPLPAGFEERVQARLANAVSLPRPTLLALVKLGKSLPSIVDRLAQVVNNLAGRLDFLKTMLDTLDIEYAMNFFIKSGIDNDSVAGVFLEFGATQAPPIPDQIVDAVTAALPQSLILFTFVSRNPTYSLRALQILQSWEDAQISKNCKLLQSFTDAATPESHDLIDAIVSRVDKTEVEFDENCSLFAKLVEWGKVDTVLSFGANPIFCRRFLTVLVPLIAPTNPPIALKVLLLALKFKSLVELIFKSDLIQILLNCVDASEFELVSHVATTLQFPTPFLKSKSAQATKLVELIETSPNPAAKSCFCLILAPFVSQRAFATTEKFGKLVSNLLTSDNETLLTSAMVLAAVLVQSREMARSMATNESLQAAIRAFGISNPALALSAAQFLGGIAPQMKPDPEGEPIVKQVVAAAVEVAAKYGENPKLLLAVAQSIATFPRGDKWDELLAAGGVGRLVELTGSSQGGSAAMADYTKMLKRRLKQ
jgi:hypothetical protein